MTGPHPYRERELIRIEAAFRAPERRYQFAGVLLDPPQDGGDLQKPCWGAILLDYYLSRMVWICLEWPPQVRREVLRSFLDLEPLRQRELLDSCWAHLRARRTGGWMRPDCA